MTPLRRGIINIFAPTISAVLASTSLSYGAPGCVTATTPTRIPTNASRQEVVITDPGILRDAASDLSLSHTLGAIISSASGAASDTAANREELLASLLRSLGQATGSNPDAPNVPMPVTVRPGEAALIPSKLLDLTDKSNGMQVVGVFNRLDLAPSNWNYCGEHRIVYEKPATDPLHRLTLIFEAAVTNPDASLRPEGCLPIAQFWAGLKNLSGPALSASLKKLFYDGIGNGFNPVVHFSHYGVPFGQVRADMFVAAPKFLWQLREWHVALNQGGFPEFISAPVGVNPLPALYGSAQPGEPQSTTDLRTAFQKDFIEKLLPELLNSEKQSLNSGKELTEDTLIFNMGMIVDRKYDALQSTSNGNGNVQADTEDDPEKSTQAGILKSKIDAALKGMDLPQQCTPSSSQVLARAGSQACGGCHHFSAGRPISPQNGIVWPASFDQFTHIDEGGQLSPLLLDRFLPERLKNLENFISTHSALPPSTGQKLTEFKAKVFASSISPRKLSLDTVLALHREATDLRQQDRSTQGAFIRFRPAD